MISVYCVRAPVSSDIELLFSVDFSQKLSSCVFVLYHALMLFVRSLRGIVAYAHDTLEFNGFVGRLDTVTVLWYTEAN